MWQRQRPCNVGAGKGGAAAHLDTSRKVVDELEDDSRHLPTGMGSGGVPGSPPSRKQVRWLDSVIWPASSAPADEACPWLQLMTGASSREKRAAGVSNTSGRAKVHTFDGHTAPPSDAPANERRSAGSCAHLCKRTMVVAPILRHTKHVLKVLQQLHAKVRVHLLKDRAPDRPTGPDPQTGLHMSSWLSPSPQMK